jgi:hypothetical protein
MLNFDREVGIVGGRPARQECRWFGPTSSVTEVIEAAEGAVVSMVTMMSAGHSEGEISRLIVIYPVYLL